jgi:hypothetical protein
MENLVALITYYRFVRVLATRHLQMFVSNKNCPTLCFNYINDYLLIGEHEDILPRYQQAFIVHLLKKLMIVGAF